MPITPGSWKCRDLEGSFLLLFSTNSEALIGPLFSSPALASASLGLLGLRGTSRSQVVGLWAEERISSGNLGYHIH